MIGTRIHDDDCGATLDADGRCPRCGFHPDMQSVSIRVDESASKPTARERMREWLGSREAYAAGADEYDFIFRELDDLRGQVATHVHHKVFSSVSIDTLPAMLPWICADCLEEGMDFETPTYGELVAKKRERSGG